jgi:DNA-directed RNA polymerase subunit H (RpoH/RPB5)
MSLSQKYRDVVKFDKVKEVFKEMMIDRGYTLGYDQIDNIMLDPQVHTVENFIVTAPGIEAGPETENPDSEIYSDRHMLVFINAMGTETIGTAFIKDVLSVINAYTSTDNPIDIHNVLIIYNGKSPSSQSLTSLEKSFTVRKIVFYHFNELAYNVSRHKDTSVFEKLSDIEVKELSRSLRMSKARIIGRGIPNISTQDAISKYYDFNKGDVIRVTQRTLEIIKRPITLADGSIYYVSDYGKRISYKSVNDISADIVKKKLQKTKQSMKTSKEKKIIRKKE